MKARNIRRHHNDRIINKRYNILKYIWHMPEQFKTLKGIVYLEDTKGYYKKFNLSCSCSMCNRNRPFKKRIPSLKEIKQDQKDMYELFIS